MEGGAALAAAERDALWAESGLWWRGAGRNRARGAVKARLMCSPRLKVYHHQNEIPTRARLMWVYIIYTANMYTNYHLSKNASPHTTGGGGQIGHGMCCCACDGLCA